MKDVCLLATSVVFIFGGRHKKREKKGGRALGDQGIKKRTSKRICVKRIIRSIEHRKRVDVTTNPERREPGS